MATEPLPFADVPRQIAAAQAGLVDKLRSEGNETSPEAVAALVEEALAPLVFGVMAQNLLLSVLTQILIGHGLVLRDEIESAIGKVEVASPDMAEVVAALQSMFKRKN